ncbi:hypothetical protein XENOCAPTIV_020928 [Xenoophorus captivus]|uniref:SH3 domain-containing protein n=1 Tax=Xenoophorus captivus TaxID=1517983 RepID=A0ABV0Q5S7_9TELE
MQSLDQGAVGNLSLEEAEPRPHPVPPLRQSFHSTDQQPLLPEKDGMETSNNPETSEPGDDSNFHNPPGFLYKAVATESNAASDEGQLQFEQGDVILVIAATQEKCCSNWEVVISSFEPVFFHVFTACRWQLDGLLRGIREESWKQHQDLDNYSGIFSEKLIQPVQAE